MSSSRTPRSPRQGGGGAKKASSSRGGPRSVASSRGGAAKKASSSRGGAARGGAPKQGAPKKGAPKHAAPKKGAPRKGAPRDGSAGSGQPAGTRGGAAKKPAAARGSAAKPPAKRVAKAAVAKRATEQRAARRRDQSSGAARVSAGKRPTPRGAPTRHGGASRGGGATRTTAARSAGTRPGTTAVHDPSGVRLQRVLAAAGLGSRRACELLIEQGRVEVDGAVVVDQGLRVDPDKAVIHVDGLRIASAHDHVYLLLNKPAGVVSTMSDPEGRTTIADFLDDREARLFHVGRLDADTEGLILVTNDGDLAHRLSHPSFGVVKTYLAEITGPVARDVGRKLKAGIELDDGPAKVDGFRLVDTIGTRVLVEVSLHEGRKHIVRRMLAEVGHPVSRLVRTDLGPLTLGNLKPGKQRKLSQQEIGALYKAVGL